MPFLSGETGQKPHTALHWTYTVGTAIREGDWKLVHLPDRLPMLYNLAHDRFYDFNYQLGQPDQAERPR